MKVIWAPEAGTDLRDIYRYIAADSPHTAQKLVNRIRQCILLLSGTPGMGRPGRVEGTRELIVSGTPYIVPYRIKGKTVQIVRVYHDGRLWPEKF